MNLLEDIIVIDFSQFLSGPSASLRMADMGAQVIKIEKKGTGDICRELYVSDTLIEGESTIFHAINRNKRSFAADLKDPDDLEMVKALIACADVVMHNFRPGVMNRLGLDYESVHTINPSVVYAEVNGYGAEGPWKNLPGQDLLVQAVSGLSWLSNDDTGTPTPMGVAVVDILAGTHLCQGILACLFQRTITGEGALVQVSMLESIIDFQFEVLTCFYNDGEQLPVRTEKNGAHAYVAAPYGIYKTADGFLALAMGSILKLGQLISCTELEIYTDPADWFAKRNEIKAIIANHFLQQTNKHWLSLLEPADFWCAPVLNYDELRKEEGYKLLQMEMEVKTSNGLTVTTTRCPIKVDGRPLLSAVGAPLLGEHNEEILKQFDIANTKIAHADHRS